MRSASLGADGHVQDQPVSFDILHCGTKKSWLLSAIVQTAKKFERDDKFQGGKKRSGARRVHENGQWWCI